MMKKLLLLLTVAIAMLALPLAAHADKTKWTNPNYDFNKLHRINLVSISVVDPVGSNFTVDDMATEKIISALQKALTKKDYVFDTSIESNLSITKEDASQLTKDALSGTYTDISTKIAPAPTADLKIIAHKFGYNRRSSPLTKNRVPDITKKRSKTIKETGSNGTQNELFMNMFRPALYMTATLM